MAYPGGPPGPNSNVYWNGLPPPNRHPNGSPDHGSQYPHYPNPQPYQLQYNDNVEYHPLQNQSRALDPAQYRQNGSNSPQNGYNHQQHQQQHQQHQQQQYHQYQQQHHQIHQQHQQQQQPQRPYMSQVPPTLSHSQSQIQHHSQHQSPQLHTPSVQAPQTRAAQPQAHSQIPRVQAPRVQSPHVQSPHVQSPHVQSPHVQSPQVHSPQVQNPRVQSPRVQVSPAQLQAPPVQAPQAQDPQVQTPPAPVTNSILDAAPSQTPQAPQFINPSQLFHQTPRSDIPQTYTGPGPDTTSRYQMAPAHPPGPVPIDLPMLIVSLAEEYFDAAHKLAPLVSTSMTAEALQEYHKLIAAGLGLLDTALKRVKMTPRIEANMRLRYASVLHEETENSMDAETALGKGIVLCDRNHYFDLKYAMQFLLAQIMLKKNPKAGLKALDSYIADAEAYQHVPWVYAFRFLRASNSLASNHPTDKWKENFESITTLAQQQSDRGIWLASCLMEALTHLRNNGPDSIEAAQGAIAAAWSYQTERAGQIPQLIALAHMIDVSCSIQQGSPNATMPKIKQLQKMMDLALKDEEAWGITNESIAIPMSRSTHSSQVVSSDTRTALGIGRDGRDNLMLSFLSKRDAFSITYLLGGLVLLHKNSQDGGAVRMFETGLAHLEGPVQKDSTPSGILPNCISRLQWQDQIICYYASSLAFCAASICDWEAVRKHIEKLNSAMSRLGTSLIGPLASISLYLSGIYHQGVGDLKTALEIFEDEKFDMTLYEGNTCSASQVKRDYSILAALNTIWILQDPAQQDVRRNNALMEKITKPCQHHPSLDIQAAFHLAAATVNRSPPLPSIDVRSHLSRALKSTKLTLNMQFTCITLSIMCNRFFVSVVGEQAEKSALAASVQANRSGNPLWMSVADGMLAQVYELNGKQSEATQALDKARRKAQHAFPGY